MCLRVAHVNPVAFGFDTDLLKLIDFANKPLCGLCVISAPLRETNWRELAKRQAPRGENEITVLPG
jgi:hypothetical protein